LRLLGEFRSWGWDWRPCRHDARLGVHLRLPPLGTAIRFILLFIAPA
jgi:hypothetical protein